LLNATDRGIGFAVWRGKENITEDQLNDPVGNDVIRIAPIIMGSKQGGVLNIILGIVLVVVGAYFDNPNLVYMGAGMIFGGVAQLLTPVPHGTKNKSVANEPSYAFNGAVNTQA
jgi:predicted phage tail protein